MLDSCIRDLVEPWKLSKGGTEQDTIEVDYRQVAVVDFPAEHFHTSATTSSISFTHHE